MMRTTLRAGLGLLLAAGLALGAFTTVDRAAATSPRSDSPRQAQPSLIEIMQGLEIDMDRVAHGVWVADFDSIAAGARAVADHPKVGPAERAEIFEVLGERAAGFRQADMLVHNTAVELAEKARAGDMGGVLDAMTRLQAGCVACHAGYRAPIQERSNP